MQLELNCLNCKGTFSIDMMFISKRNDPLIDCPYCDMVLDLGWKLEVIKDFTNRFPSGKQQLIIIGNESTDKEIIKKKKKRSDSGIQKNIFHQYREKVKEGKNIKIDYTLIAQVIILIVLIIVFWLMTN